MCLDVLNEKLKCLIIFFLHKFPEKSSFVVFTVVLKEKVILLIFSISLFWHLISISR